MECATPLAPRLRDRFSPRAVGGGTGGRRPSISIQFTIGFGGERPCGSRDASLSHVFDVDLLKMLLGPSVTPRVTTNEPAGRK